MNDFEKGATVSLERLDPATDSAKTEPQVTSQPPPPPTVSLSSLQPEPQVTQQAAQASPQAAAPNITIINQNTQQAGPLLIVREKSVLVALLLTFFFGPIGMLYSTILGAIVTFFLNLVIGIPTAGVGLVLLWPIQMIWSYMAVKNHNTGQLRQAA